MAFLILLVLLCLLSVAVRCQDTATIAQCMPQLVPLAPCGPFVQGGAPLPGQQCCDGLKQVYAQRPQCLCVVLNNTVALSSLPINTSLAFQLPALCSIQVDLSVCSSGSSGPTSPASQVSLGSTGSSSNTAVNSTIPASPAFQPPNSDSNTSNGGIINFKSNDCRFTVLMIVLMVVFVTSVLT